MGAPNRCDGYARGTRSLSLDASLAPRCASRQTSPIGASERARCDATPLNLISASTSTPEPSQQPSCCGSVPWAKYRTTLAFRLYTDSASASYVVSSSSQVWSHWFLLRATVCSAQGCRVQLNSASRDAAICTKSGTAQSPMRRAVFWRSITIHFSPLHPSTYV